MSATLTLAEPAVPHHASCPTAPHFFARAARQTCAESLAGLPDAAASIPRAAATTHAGGPPMPYRSNEDLPSSVTRHLPPHAQDIYRAAFNHAFAAHAGDPRQEEASHRIAWAAVKRVYVKSGDTWVARGDLPA
jgi:cation transport regulator